MLSSILKHPITSKTLLAQIRSVQGIMQKYFICDKRTFSTAVAIRMFLTRCTRLSDGATRPTSFLKSNGLLKNILVKRQMSQLDVNTNVQNNVILYKFERNAYFRNVQIFAVAQLFGWFLLAYYTYKPSFWDIFYTDIKFKDYLWRDAIWLSTCLFSLIVGPFMFLFIYATCARSIKYIILNKGGKTLSITTYHILKKKSNINVPLGMAKCAANRMDVGAVLPIKIENKSFFYLIDRKGAFVNPKLFDYAMG
ncbi:PREDICTED: transmembrane protein 223 [Wasmannia auropunctata]|uniref:transmembrane protein 223 n=1 Tax=Wasmannia auropunctata TaxID=64793 RepID=UPI0005EDC31A|nr:PREDICTED: transmembrane protein 223 [Wasmannia auropunctata]XP_011691019.1 PREDICTED: transmembrane protein 223 [Wasmannia auropunctata]XP_011691020.1 PREDICTED: transmembrane protein 223 [Wasmannia auropunctata]